MEQLPAVASEISILHLFWKADWVVKLVMIGLLTASVGVWAIAIDKFILYSRARQAMKHFENVFWSGQSLEDLYRALAARPTDSMAALFVAAMREWKRSFEGPHPAIASLQMRLEKVMEVTIQREVERLEKWLLVLATVGSASPFVGLFGTVWGIMVAFMEIGNQATATLAVVAPPIAEALIATAMGLFAAIPAVVAYNRYADKVVRLEYRYDGFTEEFSSILHRHARAKLGG
jgi:biopolymer transport protein TolQ